MDMEAQSCECGHPMYSARWIPVLQVLICERELDKTEDRYAMEILKDIP